MKNSNDTIGKRARDLPDCSAVTQPTAPMSGDGILTPTCCHGMYMDNFTFHLYLARCVDSIQSYSRAYIRQRGIFNIDDIAFQKTAVYTTLQHTPLHVSFCFLSFTWQQHCTVLLLLVT